MKQILLIITIFLLCGTASAAYYIDEETGHRTPLMKAKDSGHFIIHVLVWSNDTAEREEGVRVTFAKQFTYITANDGSVCFDTANIEGVKNGDVIDVSCKYGTKLAIVDYSDAHFGLTFNEPSESIAIEAFAAMGLIATALGGGLYLLRRKKQISKQEVNMTCVK